MPDDLHEIEQRFPKALEEREEKPNLEDKQQQSNTCLAAVIAAVL